jgi:hypothetical protein
VATLHAGRVSEAESIADTLIAVIRLLAVASLSCYCSFEVVSLIFFSEFINASLEAVYDLIYRRAGKHTSVIKST